jgi:hypothetical protein
MDVFHEHGANAVLAKPLRIGSSRAWWVEDIKKIAKQ